MRIIREAATIPGYIRVTTPDERWYLKEDNPNDRFASVTWILSFYPKGAQFLKWLANTGFDEANAIKQAAGTKGTAVHKAIEWLLLNPGKTISMSSTTIDPETGIEREYTVEEWECIWGFVNWWEETQPELLDTERTVWNLEHRFAGTCDLRLRINGEVWVVDIKTSKSIRPEYALQLSAYKHTEGGEGNERLGIIHIGRAASRAKGKFFKFVEVEDAFDDFLAVMRIWKREAGDEAPRQYEYPEELSINNEAKRATSSDKPKRARTKTKSKE